MAYARQQHARLGSTSSAVALTLATAGANALVPGSGTAVAVGAGLLTNLFGGAGRDAQRQARCDWFAAAAKQGSILAGRILLGGISNTAGNESPMYQKAVQQLASSAAMAQAELLGPYWDSSDDSASTKMRALVEQDLANSGIRTMTPTTPRTTATGGAGVMLPAMTTTAPFNYTPWLIGGGVGLFLLTSGGRRGRR